ncbi:macrophage immunometabolism regulator [Grus japonensis]|uniref:ribonuclease H n=1 Tax=Grus japonensis TaxID=30415 RepID=A0ABC9YAY7_GRUJA
MNFTPPMTAAMPDMLELQYELESKAAKWYATMDIANAFFSIPLVAECRPQFAFTWRGVQYTWNRLPQGWKHSPTICHGLIQTALEKGEAPEHLQYIEDIIVWGNSAEEMYWVCVARFWYQRGCRGGFSKTDPPLAKAEPISASVITY